MILMYVLLNLEDRNVPIYKEEKLDKTSFSFW